MILRLILGQDVSYGSIHNLQLAIPIDTFLLIVLILTNAHKSDNINKKLLQDS